MSAPELPRFDFADEIRGDAGRGRNGLLIAAVVLLVVALAIVGMAFAPARPKSTLRVSWVAAPHSVERAFSEIRP